MFVTGGIREKQPLHVGCDVEREQCNWLLGLMALFDLLAEKLLGENHPEGEESNKCSGCCDGDHAGESSEIVITLVSTQVVTRLLRGC